jgi:GAF domain-containing protein
MGKLSTIKNDFKYLNGTNHNSKSKDSQQCLYSRSDDSDTETELDYSDSSSASESDSCMQQSYRSLVVNAYTIPSFEQQEEFDKIIMDAKSCFCVPTAVLFFYDHKKKICKEMVGLDMNFAPRIANFCARTMEDLAVTKSLMVLDTKVDERYKDDPLVTGPTRLQFFAAAPLVSPEGIALGSLCLFDSRARPRGLSMMEQQRLRGLADEAVFCMIMDCQ